MKKRTNIRVAFLDDHLSHGGSTINLIRLLPTLKQRDIEPMVLASDQDNVMGSGFTRAGVATQFYPFGDRGSLYDDRILAAYRRLAEFAPHVVVASHESVSFDLLRYTPPEVFRVAVVRTDEAWSYGLVRSHAPWVDAAVGGTRAICRGIQKAADMHPVRIVRIPNGVTPPASLPACETRDPVLRILFIGRVAEKQKRVTRFIPIWNELVRRNIPVTWTFAGEGPEKERLTAEMVSTERQKVCFPGEIPQDEVGRVCLDNDVVVLASDYEGLTIGVLEGMAHGLIPVLTAQHGEVPDMIDDTCGFCVPPDDPEAFVDVLAGLEKGSQRFNALRKAAYEKICREFTQERKSEAWATLIREGGGITDPHWPRRHHFLGPLGASGWRRGWYFAPAFRPLRRVAHAACVACGGR